MRGGVGSRQSAVGSETAEKVPLWKKILRALRVSVKPGKTLKEPIREVWIKGKIEF